MELCALGFRELAQVRNQRVGGLDTVLARAEPDQASNEFAQVCGRRLPSRHPGFGAWRRGRWPRGRQLFGDLVEVDLKVMGQEVSGRSLPLE